MLSGLVIGFLVFSRPPNVLSFKPGSPPLLVAKAGQRAQRRAPRCYGTTERFLPGNYVRCEELVCYWVEHGRPNPEPRLTHWVHGRKIKLRGKELCNRGAAAPRRIKEKREERVRETTLQIPPMRSRNAISRAEAPPPLSRLAGCAPAHARQRTLTLLYSVRVPCEWERVVSVPDPARVVHGARIFARAPGRR